MGTSINEAESMVIESLIEENKKESVKGRTADFEYIDFRSAYLSYLKKYVDFRLFRKRGLKAVVDPMHGSGAFFLEDLLLGQCWADQTAD